MRNISITPKAPHPYPDGDPCGYAGHYAWCRCAPADAYRCGQEEYNRIRKRNEELRAASRKDTVVGAKQRHTAADTLTIGEALAFADEAERALRHGYRAMDRTEGDKAEATPGGLKTKALIVAVRVMAERLRELGCGEGPIMTARQGPAWTGIGQNGEPVRDVTASEYAAHCKRHEPPPLGCETHHAVGERCCDTCAFPDAVEVASKPCICGDPTCDGRHAEAQS